VSVRLYVLQGRTGQGRAGKGRAGGQTFSVTPRITDFWPRSGFGNFDLLLLFTAAVSKDHWPKVMGTHGGLHSGLRRAPTGDFTVAFGHGHPLVLRKVEYVNL
jgi:hypothetical protein